MRVEQDLLTYSSIDFVCLCWTHRMDETLYDLKNCQEIYILGALLHQENSIVFFTS